MMAVIFDSVRFRKLLTTQPWDAFEDLFKHYRLPLKNIANRFSHDKNAADDIVQDTFAEIWKRRGNLKPFHDKSVENYLARAVQYKAIEHYKRRHYASLDVLMVYKEFIADDDNLQSIIEKELYREFRKFIETLPPRQKQCMTMKIDEELSLDEIAARLGISRKTVELSQTISVKKLTKWASHYDSGK